MSLTAALGPGIVQADMPGAGVHWARVLQKYVNDHGQVDFCGLAKDPADLLAYLDYVERVSPQNMRDAFPTRGAALAYHINSYNALAMYNVIASGMPKELGWLTRLRFFGGRRFVIGGKAMTLYTYENTVIRPLGDERVHFALNCMVIGCPQLPTQPFSGEHLDAQLEMAAQRFFSEPRNLQVDPARGTVRVSSILKFYENDFLTRSPTLLAYINRYAPVTLPPWLEVEFIPYDWSINIQEHGCQPSD
ncbi:DUF547 domain-containing protein [Cupriavidus sp. NPDC089707]|uniref:DUF547 domain-containing protein n=1 Tax=Cupriavidus sp. NPDC089707 TaxID=3363963 RepID=UPI00381B897B